MGVYLFAKRVMIMEMCQDLLPRYLRFIRGIVDVGDLPLNISCQRLQEDRHVNLIQKWLARRTLDTLREMLEKKKQNVKYSVSALLEQLLFPSVKIIIP